VEELLGTVFRMALVLVGILFRLFDTCLAVIKMMLLVRAKVVPSIYIVSPV